MSDAPAAARNTAEVAFMLDLRLRTDDGRELLLEAGASSSDQLLVFEKDGRRSDGSRGLVPTRDST